MGLPHVLGSGEDEDPVSGDPGGLVSGCDGGEHPLPHERLFKPPGHRVAVIGSGDGLVERIQATHSVPWARLNPPGHRIDGVVHGGEGHVLGDLVRGEAVLIGLSGEPGEFVVLFGVNEPGCIGDVDGHVLFDDVVFDGDAEEF